MDVYLFTSIKHNIILLTTVLTQVQAKVYCDQILVNIQDCNVFFWYYSASTTTFLPPAVRNHFAGLTEFCTKHIR